MNAKDTSHPVEPGTATVTDNASAGPAAETARLAETAAEASMPIEWARTLGLVQAVAEANDRHQAVVAIVKYTADQFPSSTIHCAIGASSIRRFYDSRLGWLGPASDLFQDAAGKWDEQAASLTTRAATVQDLPQKAQPSQREFIRMNIDDAVGLGRCVLWIKDCPVSANERIWLRRCALPSLRAILWQRSGGMPDQLARALAASGMTTRIYLGLACLLFILLAVWPVSYRVRCSTLVRTKHSRVVSAPFEARLDATHVDPGDPVNAGDILITLDGRQLRLELEAVAAQIGQVRKERDISMVGGRVAESQQAKLRIRELSRQHDLLASRLERLSVISPIDGIVVLGDLNRSIGATLETGQALLEIAPLDQMVIELEVPEHEIDYVDKGTIARVRLTAGDGELIEQSVDVVYPTAELRNDQNVFIARINVGNPDGALRPGMRGDAIAYGPPRPWIWSLVRTGWEKTLWWIGY